METYAVIDFETTGLSPGYDRIIEVGVVLVRDETIVDTFSELMDPGFRIPSYITELTGISSSMVRGKPSPEAVMPMLREIIGPYPCVAHNASFDRGFFGAEMRRAGVACEPLFLCSMLLARAGIARRDQSLTPKSRGPIDRTTLDFRPEFNRLNSIPITARTKKCYFGRGYFWLIAH